MLLETVATGASETNLQLLCGIRDVAAVTVPAARCWAAAIVV